MRWVARQVTYYEGGRGTMLSQHGSSSPAASCSFAGTIAAAALHASAQAEGRSIVVLTIALPAFAGALAGIAGLELHGRHAAQFRLMARRLGDLQDRLASAADLSGVREIAFSIEARLRTEGEAWIDVMRIQEVELPS